MALGKVMVCAARDTHLGVHCTVILFQALCIVLDPVEDISIHPAGNVDQYGHCQHHVHKEDDAQ